MLFRSITLKLGIFSFEYVPVGTGLSQYYCDSI